MWCVSASFDSSWTRRGKKRIYDKKQKRINEKMKPSMLPPINAQF